MKPKSYFQTPKLISHKQYEALRMFFVDGKSGKETADFFGYTYRGFTTIASNFRKHLATKPETDLFFAVKPKGRKQTDKSGDIDNLIINMRKRYLSVSDIKISLDGMGHNISETYIYLIIKREGFSRLPRRKRVEKDNLELPKIEAPKSRKLWFEKNESFKTNNGGLLCLLAYIRQYGIDKLILNSMYPETGIIDRLASILSFVALKLSNVRRYSCDDLWCMDRGAGLFAGLNTLPKTGWYTSYSHRITRAMNINFLKGLHKIWQANGLLSDTANLDFTAIPYWGDNEHLENNWSGKRNKTLPSILALLAQDPDTGIIDYGDTTVLHKDQNAVVLEYLDFYRDADMNGGELTYLVFDSKFTNYENLNKLNNKKIKFVTIRRRGKNLIEKISSNATKYGKVIKVECAGNKKRSIKAYDHNVDLKGYDKSIRQIEITGHGKIKPAIILTNEFDLKLEELVRKYAKRWIVEKGISEQIEFFHLNRTSSSMVIKVDFDLTMTILAHNIYRLFAFDMERYSHMTSQKLFELFINNAADVEITKNTIVVKLLKKRNLPLILEKMEKYADINYPWIGNKKLMFEGASYS